MEINLSDKYGYDLACGLRGPDNGISTSLIKWIFPCRIRWYAEANRGKAAVRWTKCIRRFSSDDFHRYYKEAKVAGRHCIGHYLTALRALWALGKQDKEIELLGTLARKTKTYLLATTKENEEEVRKVYNDLIDLGRKK